MQLQRFFDLIENPSDIFRSGGIACDLFHFASAEKKNVELRTNLLQRSCELQSLLARTRTERMRGQIRQQKLT